FTVMAALTAGATCVLLEEYSASRYWDQVRRHRATQTSMVAMQVRTLLAQEPGDDDRDHVLRRVVYAINVSDAEKEAFEDRFGVRFLNAYGLSEAMTLVTTSPLFGPQRWPSIGLPAAERQIRLVDPEGNDVPTGEIGEILVGGVPGRTLMKGYHKDEAATAQALAGGWLHTGDHGYADEHGYVYFFDRKKDVIKRAGENVSASEVETALVDHPAIVEAAVIGIVDDVRDEAVKAFVVCVPGEMVSLEDVRDHCVQRLASFKIPTEIEVLAELPKTSIGKVEKKVLRARQTGAT
ncbi:MAG: AMP-binding protein, partial [Actinomycetota bacterium]